MKRNEETQELIKDIYSQLLAMWDILVDKKIIENKEVIERIQKHKNFLEMVINKIEKGEEK